jgi:hypothetical protein
MDALTMGIEVRVVGGQELDASAQRTPVRLWLQRDGIQFDGSRAEADATDWREALIPQCVFLTTTSLSCTLSRLYGC